MWPGDSHRNLAEIARLVEGLHFHPLPSQRQLLVMTIAFIVRYFTPYSFKV
jgi:hypothetical protein